MFVRGLSRFGLALAALGLSAGVVTEPSSAQASSNVASQCAGIDADAQSKSFTSLASQAKRITRVESIGKAPMHRTAGVEVFVAAREGWSAEYVQRLVGCQIARAADQGGQDVLAVPGIRVEVAARGDGYRVRLTSLDVSHAQELVRRMGL